MASVKEKIETVVTKSYQLDLSETEAEVLATILGRIGGPKGGPRGDMQEILDALISIGIKFSGTASGRILMGSMDFK